MTSAVSPARAERPRPPQASGPTVGVAFGGGGARGLAHIHVIAALNELGMAPTVISGASIGAIMGAGMAAGMSGDEIRDYTLSTVGSRSEIWNRFWSMRRVNVREAASDGFRFGQINVERLLKAFLPGAIPGDFSDLIIPTKIIATDFYAHTEIVCDHGDLRNAIAASAAIPAVFRPVRRNGRIMIDGGIYNPVPFDHLRGSADITIGVDVVGGPVGDANRMPRTLDSIFGATQLMMQSIITMKLKQGGPDIMVRPEVNRFRVLDFLKAAEIIEASKGVRERLKRDIDAVIAARAKGREPDRHSRVTGG